MKIDITYYYNYYLEIKHRLFLVALAWLFTTAVSYFYKDSLLFFVVNSSNSVINLNKQQSYFIFTDISEIFYAYLTIIFFISNQIGLNVLLYHFLLFLALGLYKFELNKFKFLFQIFLITWMIYSFIFYKILTPFSWNFFLNFQQNDTLNQPISLFFEAKLFDFLNFFINFYNLCFLSSQFLVITVFFLSDQAKKKNQIKNFRKIFYSIFLIFSTIITPPDIFSQILITFYLILMYELIIFLNYLKLNLATS